MIKVSRTAKRRPKELRLEIEKIEKSAIIIRAINHPLRQKILLLIHKNGNNSVSEIYSKLKLEQSVTSAHLAILRKSGFVLTERDGQNIYYSVNYERIEQLHSFATLLLS